MRLRDRYILCSTSFIALKTFLYLSIYTLLQWVWCEGFGRLLGNAEVCAIPKNLTRPLLHVRRWGLGMRLSFNFLNSAMKLRG